jgi:hypothetical protein
MMSEGCWTLTSCPRVSQNTNKTVDSLARVCYTIKTVDDKERDMNISNLERLVKEENRWMEARGAQPFSLLSARDRQEIATIIECRLSPEHLTCDGELSRAQIQKKYNFLTRCARELQSIDPEIQFYEFS